MKPLHLLRAGRFLDSKGQLVTVTENDLKELAAGYDPALREAPLVIGHPESDKPAYGWVSKLNTKPDGLHGDPIQVSSQFADLVRRGSYKKISVAMYGREHPNNPTPGKLYLRHVGFHGAQPTAVSGLRNPEFADGDEPDMVLDVALSELADVSPFVFGSIARSLRGLRDWIISRDGLETANQVLSEYNIENISEEETRLRNADQPEEEATMTGLTEQELNTRNTDLDSREAELARREAALADGEKSRQRETLKADITKLADAGKILPVDIEPLVALSEQVAGVESATVSFAEGNATKTQDTTAWLAEFLERLPVQVDYRERGAGDLPDTTDARRFATSFADGDIAVGNMDLYHKVVAYADKHNVSFEEAAETLGGDLPTLVADAPADERDE